MGDLDRKGDLRDFTPNFNTGMDTTAGGMKGAASKDSLIDKNVVTEFVPGKLEKGKGQDGGKAQFTG